EAPAPIAVTSTHPFDVQVLNADGDWIVLASYEEGAQEIELPAAEADYRLVVAGTDTVEETISEVLQVRFREEAPVPTPDADDDGDNNGIVPPPARTTGNGRGVVTTMTPAGVTTTTGS